MIRARFWSEFFGTFAIVFFGTGAVVSNQITGGAITHVGIVLTFGLVVTAAIYTFGDVSGAHFNPAVTLAFALARRFEAHCIYLYILAQLGGALLASSLLRMLFPTIKDLGVTLPRGSEWQSLVLEIVTTWFLMLVILSVSTGTKAKGITAGIVIGAVISVEAMFAGPISGASMNPARSLGPALLSHQLSHLWIYFVGPIAGALLAVPTLKLVRCDSEPESEPKHHDAFPIQNPAAKQPR